MTGKLPRWSAIDEDRDLRVRQDFDRLAAEDDRRDAAAPVRGHQDQVAAVRSGGLDDRLVDVFVLDVARLAGDTGQLGRVGNTGQRLFRGSLRVFLVFVPRVFELARLDREHVERLGDGHRGNLGADLLGQGDTVFDGPAGKFRPVGRDQDVLVQGGPPVGRCFAAGSIAVIDTAPIPATSLIWIKQNRHVAASGQGATPSDLPGPVSDLAITLCLGHGATAILSTQRGADDTLPPACHSEVSPHIKQPAKLSI